MCLRRFTGESSQIFSWHDSAQKALFCSPPEKRIFFFIEYDFHKMWFSLNITWNFPFLSWKLLSMTFTSRNFKGIKITEGTIKFFITAKCSKMAKNTVKLLKKKIIFTKTMKIFSFALLIYVRVCRGTSDGLTILTPFFEKLSFHILQGQILKF